MKLISEALENVKFLAEEDDKGEKNYKIEGIFMQGDIKNRNGRVYPVEVLEKEIKRYNKEFIEKNRAYGELGHPEGPTVNLDRVSHMVTSLKREGSNFIGEAKIMETPMGKIVKNIMNEGGMLGVSSRGMGSLEQKNGANYVKDDFMLAAAADIVADPSAPQAFVNGIMEGVDWVWDNGILKPQEIELIETEIKRAPAKVLPELEIKAFKNFLSRL